VPKTHALDRTATGIGNNAVYVFEYCHSLRMSTDGSRNM
jgi:hypothetical protein